VARDDLVTGGVIFFVAFSRMHRLPSRRHAASAGAARHRDGDAYSMWILIVSAAFYV